MARMRKEKEKKIDGTLLVTVWILLGLGLVILYSASARITAGSDSMTRLIISRSSSLQVRSV